MPEITGLKERRGRVRVFVDGEFRVEIDAAVAAERGLREGDVLPEEELGEALLAGERSLGMNRALNLLGYRARSEGELRGRLSRHGHSEAAIEAVVGRLEELGYLDDEEFARGMAHQKARKYGPRRVSLELQRGGVDAATAEVAVEEAFEELSEGSAAREAASRRYNTAERSDALARRVYGFLTRRGYSADVCAEVAREYRVPHAD